jgi:VCBS repeat-containing protein
VAVNGHQAEQYLSQEHPGFDHRIMGEYGTLYFNSVSGAYEYVADNADALFEGDKAQDYFAVTVTDNHGASSDNNLIVEITGTNDAPLINVESHSLDTDMTYSASLTGSIVFSDVDSPRESLVLSVGGEEIKWDDYVIHGKYGDLTVNKDGTYTYEVKDMDALANAGPEGLREDFSARVDDDGNAYSEANFSITVTHNSIGVVGDAIVGTAGNDVLQVGHHDVYGGGGNDVFVVTQDSGQVNVNGGPGLDVMLITPEFDGDVDDLLARTHNVEVVVKGLDAAAANDLTSVGIVVDDRGLSLSSDWMVGAPDANGYQTYINSSGGELTVALGVSVSLESEQSTQTIQQHIITAG